VCSFFVGKAQSPSKILHFGSFKAYSYPKTLWRKADEAQCFGDPVAIGRIRPIFFRPTSGRWSHGPAAAWPANCRPSLWRVPSAARAQCEDLCPLLTKGAGGGDESVVREYILNGTPRMPSFKYFLQPAEIDAVVAYLKTVPA